MSDFKINKLITKHQSFSEFKDADKIIAYLQGNENAELPHKLKIKLDQYKLVQSLRMRYKKRSYIANKLRFYFSDIDLRAANTIIADAEYVFGKVFRVDRDFEKAFMLEISRKSIEIAVKSGNSDKINKAVLAHKEILGPDPDETDLPDFSAFEAHHYTFQLPKGLPEALMELLKGGAIDISKVMPSQMLKAAIKDATDVEDIKDEA